MFELFSTAYCITLLINTHITLDANDDQVAASQAIFKRLFEILQNTQHESDILCDAVGFTYMHLSHQYI